MVNFKANSVLTALAVSMLFLSGLFVATPDAFAQDYGGFRGRTVDPSGAAIPNARVKATEQKSGITSSTVANTEGEYELRGLLPGTYMLEVTAPSFKAYRDTGVILYARDVRRVDVQLELGSVETAVEVRERGSTIQTDTAAITYKTATQEIYGLNVASWLIYRIDLNPGAESRNQVHGGFANQTNAEQDGIATNAYGSWRAPQETTREIHEVALNAPAEYRTSATVIGVGKQGTNSLHAEVFLNYQNAALNALAVGQKTRPPGLPVKLWSYEVSGPVYLPKVYNGKNKTFFHFLFQPQPSSRTAVFHQGFIVPTPKMRAGDLSEYASFRGITIKNPYTGQPFPNNVVPDSMISPVAKNILKLLPDPNHTSPFGPLVDNFNWTDFSLSYNRWWQFSIQHRLTSKNSLSFNYYRYTNTGERGLEGNPFPSSGFREDDWTNSFSIQDTHTFSPHLLNESALTWNRQHSIWAPGNILGKDFLTKLLGITDFGPFKIADGPGNPRVTVQTLGNQLATLSGSYNAFPALLIGSGASNPYAGFTDYTDGYVWQFRDNVSYSRGKHLFKTGLEVRKQRPNQLNAITGDTFGQFVFTGNFSGYDYGDLLLGLPYTTDIDAVRSKVEAREWEIGGFIQDDWKVTPKLTITPGLRLQHYGVPYEANGIWYNFDAATQRVVVPDNRALEQVVSGFPIPVVTAKDAGYPERLREFKQILWEPRLGVAYRPFEKTVFRAAYGVYHVPFVSSAAWAVANVFGDIDRAGILAGLANGPFRASSKFGPNQIVNGVPEFTLDHPFPPSTTLGPQTIYSAPVNGRGRVWPYDQQWNITIERELPLGFSARASYVGTKGTDWPYVTNIDTPVASTNPFTVARRPFDATKYSSVNIFDLGGNSSHHGLELEATRQFSSGLYFRAWYGWLKSLNDVQGGLFGSSTGTFIEYPYNRAREKGWQDGLYPHKSRWMAVYQLPVGRGQRYGTSMPGFLNQIIGNWTVVPYFDVETDQRFTPSFSGKDTANVGVSGGRPDAVCNGDHLGSGPGIIWNRACYAVPANGTLGTASRGSLSGPLTWNLNFNVFKQFYLLPGKESGPYLKFEMYSNDIFNHHNSSNGPASLDIASPNFGLFQPSGSRSIYFRLRAGF